MKRKNVFYVIMFAFLLTIIGMGNIHALYDDYTCGGGSGTKTCLSPGVRSSECSISNPWTVNIDYGGASTAEFDPGFAICKSGTVSPAFCIEIGTNAAEKFHNNVTLTASTPSSEGIYCALSNYISTEYSNGRGQAAVDLLTDAIESPFDSEFSSTTYVNPGYNNSNLTSKMKVQKIIWSYIGFSGTCSSIVEYKAPTTITSDTTPVTRNVTVNINNANLRLSDDASYYVSDEIIINSYADYLVSFDPGTMGAVLCEDSECATEMDTSSAINKAKSKVYIKIPVENITSPSDSVKLKVEFSYTKNKTVTTVEKHFIETEIIKYHTEDAQDLITYTLTPSSPVTTSDSPNSAIARANGTVGLQTASVKVIKTDAKSKGKFVEGAVYKLYRKTSTGSYVDAVYFDGSEIDPDDLITDEDGEIHISNLPYGDYKIEEVSAPKGYTISEDAVEFELDEDKTFNFTNTPRKIIFSKQDIAKSGELKGAKICIYNYDDVNNKRGSEVKCYMSGQEPGYENKPYEYYLSPGVYSLVEDGAPAGYEKLETEFVFKVNDKYEIELESAKSKNNIQINDNKITIFNQVLETPDVPNTGKIAKIAYSIIGTILIVSGSALIILVNKKKKLAGQI